MQKLMTNDVDKAVPKVQFEMFHHVSHCVYCERRWCTLGEAVYFSIAVFEKWSLLSSYKYFGKLFQGSKNYHYLISQEAIVNSEINTVPHC
jgi:hypothetical protein